MKALVKKKPEEGIWLDDVPEPEVGHNDVLIQVRKTAICGTDVHIYNWDAWAQKTIPMGLVVGHEFVGRVESIGSNVTGFEPGDLVAGEGHIVCGRCRNCMAGRRHLCAHTSGIGVNRPGAFAEYISLPMSNVWVHRPGIDLDIASIFDPFGNAVHTALKYPVLGGDVLITGAGPVGLMAAAVVNHAGARSTVVTDVNPYRLDLALKMGASRVVDRRTQDLESVQRELGMTEGFDVALEVSGNPAAYEDILNNTIHGANVALLGIPSEPFAIDWQKAIFNMLNLKGIYGREMFDTWYKMNVLVQSGLDISPVITHRFDAEDHEDAFTALRGSDSAKVLLRWSD